MGSKTNYNSHPHRDMLNNYELIHNEIIKNYEINHNVLQSIKIALSQLEGTYVLIIMSLITPDIMYVAKKYHYYV